MISAPDKLGSTLPSEAQVLALFPKVKAKSLEQYKDMVANVPLLPRLPTGGTITATKTGMEKGISVTYRATKSVTFQSNLAADLVLAKVVGRSVTLTWDVAQKRQIAAGGSVTYSIVVQNNGPSIATGVVVSDPTPTGIAFLSLSSATVSCTSFPCSIGTLNPGQSVTLTSMSVRSVW